MKHANIKVNSITFKDNSVLKTAALSSGDITYQGTVFNIEELISETRLGGLYLDIEPKPIYEKGQVLKTIKFKWTYKSDIKIKEQNLKSILGDINIDKNLREYTLSKVEIRNDIDYILNSQSLMWKESAIFKIRFGSRIYYGATKEEVNSGNVLGVLNSNVFESYLGFKKKLRDIKGRIYLLIPTRFLPLEHSLDIYINDMLDTGFTIEEREIINPFNLKENYLMYKSIYSHKGGNLSIEIRSDR